MHSLNVLFHVKHEADLSKAWVASSLGIEVSTRAVALLGEFEALLRERGVPLGLVSASDERRIRQRHVLDSLRAVAAARDEDELGYDIGSGAGLPGLVVAIARPRLRVVLVEPRRSRAAFLELAVERLEVSNASVLVGRIEDVTEPADICFARAYAPLPQAWRVALPLLRPGGRLVYFAGSEIELPPPLPGAGDVTELRTPVLESVGSLIIMSR